MSGYDGDVEQKDHQEPAVVRLQPLASAGLNRVELDVVLSAISTTCIKEGVPFDNDQENFKFVSEPATTTSLPGASGRVLVLTAHGESLENEEMMNDDDEWLLPIKFAISNQLDQELYAVPDNGFDQPLLVHLSYHESLNVSNAIDALAMLQSVVKEESDAYELCHPLTCKDGDSTKKYIPSTHIELDGAMVQADIRNPTHQTVWDTSSVLVFDNLVDEDLRKRLLSVVKGNDGTSNEWNDIEDGPDPSRWVRGGLMDVPDDSDEHLQIEEEEVEKPCWGLSDDAIVDLCYSRHDAIEEFECRLAELFPQFHVCRLPEAVLGATVSPLTANAPTHGDTFSFHIDADPLQAPPSPWTDVFGRYPNRSAGKPRFMSCLVYLNDEWNDSFGAPTRFLDPPTQETYDVKPKPGRVCIMDQDCSHTVTAPTEAAGKRPRYSLVWKLILHPKEPNQDMTKLDVNDRPAWPLPILVGSASGSPVQ